MHATNRRERWLVIFLAALIGTGIAWISSAQSRAATGCVWASGADGAQVQRFFLDWIAARHGPTLTGLDVSLGERTAQIELGTKAGVYHIALLLGPQCSDTPEAQLLRREDGGGFPTAGDLHTLAVGFPAPKLQLSKGSGGSASVIIALFTIMAFVGLGLVMAAPSPRTTWGTAGDVGWVLCLVGLAAWPILFAPFDTDAPVLRAAFAAIDVFGDWNHPFLPYLLNRPTTWFSLEPWALRLVPLAGLGLETALLMLAASRDGGKIAGALAGVWFACEVRRRHGLFDLGDWDVAGTFLVALLLVLQRRERIGWRDAFIIGTLMAAGVMSSWLMIVVAGVVTGCVAIEAARGRATAGPTIALGAAFAVLAARSLDVFAAGSGQAPIVTAGDLWRQMYEETPLGRSVTMALPIALGAGWLVSNRKRLSARFATLSMLAVPAAVAVAYQRSHVNGGYYVGLVTPLLLYTAAVATAQIIELLADRAARALPSGGFVIRGVAVLALGVATIGRLNPSALGVGAEHLRLLAHETRANSLPIFSNSSDLPRLLAYERARAGEGPIGDVIEWGPPDLRPRFHLLEGDTCAPAIDVTPAGFYLVYLDSGDKELRRDCAERLAPRCHDISPVVSDSDRRNWILRCNGQLEEAINP